MKPTLLVLAAGMGSRYGGLKQLDGLGPHGETIMDYSVFDAWRAGFGKIVFVIRHDFEDEFRARVLTRYEGMIPAEVVFQSVDALPEGYSAPEGRTRPWGTNHAIMMGQPAIDEPFAVINADDFYGRHAFEVIANFLKDHAGQEGRYCMVAFRVGNTITESGSVSRGVCTVDASGMLQHIVEHRKIQSDTNGNIVSLDENTGEKRLLDANTPVSMNLWGFQPDYFGHSAYEFDRFLNKYINVEGSEFFIPSVVDCLIKDGKATVDVLDTDSRWFGVTYAQDREGVVANLRAFHEQGEYPDNLFSHDGF